MSKRPWQKSAKKGIFVTDPLTGAMAELQPMQPYQAQKDYLCPGCNHEIRAGTGHVVVVPLSDPSHRRHWHSPCLDRARRHGPR